MVRSLPADPIILQQDWLEAYDFVTTSGAVALNDYARSNDPFARLAKQLPRGMSRAPLSG